MMSRTLLCTSLLFAGWLGAWTSHPVQAHDRVAFSYRHDGHRSYGTWRGSYRDPYCHPRYVPAPVPGYVVTPPAYYAPPAYVVPGYPYGYVPYGGVGFGLSTRNFGLWIGR
ncbi:MAG: hypothetical protein KatS3mg113_0152 [Planctomycetaceae bacterium]|nr:MAG: hypothetical protein KatS3mg113_0152 [Planctomycetaceae bacterium]